LEPSEERKRNRRLPELGDLGCWRLGVFSQREIYYFGNL
jgi:hypothetical protein